MDMQNEAKSVAKRHRKNDKNEPRKSRRLASSAKRKYTTKIIDLNDDCLLKIFGHLDVKSLFNVAVANEFQRPAASEEYKRKCGKNRVNISGCDDFRPNKRVVRHTGHQVYDQMKVSNQIDVSGLKTCLLYLRCFGPSITELWIDYNKSMSKRINYVHQYINDYCMVSLTKITFSRMPNIAFEQFQKVFAHVEDITIRYSILGEQWSSFVKSFPNLRRLEIIDVDIEQSVAIQKPFKHLEHLKIPWCDTVTTNQLATALLYGVHHLKKLPIQQICENNPKVPISVLMDMIKEKSSITKLVYNSLHRDGHIPVNSVDVQRIITEHAALIKLRLEDYVFTAADAAALICQLHSLTKFQFQLENSQQNDLASRLNDKWDINYERMIDEDHTWVELTRKM